MSGKAKKGKAKSVDQHEHTVAEHGRDNGENSVTEVAENAAAEMTAAEAVEVSEIDALQAQLAAVQQKADENWNLALRTQAEMENLRKRVQRDIENAHKYGLEKIAAELLGVRDSMELGLSAAQEPADINSLREGVELTLKMLAQLMDKFEIVQLNPVNERFNPELHQAMAMQESDKVEPNTVLAVMQKGYTLNGRLLRPALVTVAKAPSQAS